MKIRGRPCQPSAQVASHTVTEAASPPKDLSALTSLSSHLGRSRQERGLRTLRAGLCPGSPEPRWPRGLAQHLLQILIKQAAVASSARSSRPPFLKLPIILLQTNERTKRLFSASFSLWVHEPAGQFGFLHHFIHRLEGCLAYDKHPPKLSVE